MIDIISLSIAITSISIAIFSHIKHSKCLNCIEIETRTPLLQKE